MHLTLIRNCTPTVNRPDTAYFAFTVFVLMSLSLKFWAVQHRFKSPLFFALRGVKGIFLGLTLPLGSKSIYALIDLKVFVSIHVVCLHQTDNYSGYFNTIQRQSTTVSYYTSIGMWDVSITNSSWRVDLCSIFQAT